MSTRNNSLTLPNLSMSNRATRRLFKSASRVTSFELPKELMDDPIGYIDNCLGDSARRLMNELMRYYGKYKSNVFVGQATLAQRIGLKSDRHVRRLLDKLIAAGFIAKKTVKAGARGLQIKSYCKYRINKFFGDVKIKSILRYFFPAIVCLSENMVYSIRSAYQQKCPPILKKGIYKDLISSLSYRNQYKKKRDDFEYEKENTHQRVCVENQAKGREFLEILMKEKEIPKVEAIPVTPLVVMLTEKDIPKERMDKIRRLSVEAQPKVIENILKGMQLVLNFNQKS